MTDLVRPEATAEIMQDLRRFLLGIYYSTSGYCSDEERWRWAWQAPETLSDTYTVPETSTTDRLRFSTDARPLPDRHGL